jgi:hypothetical protein
MTLYCTFEQYLGFSEDNSFQKPSMPRAAAGRSGLCQTVSEPRRARREIEIELSEDVSPEALAASPFNIPRYFSLRSLGRQLVRWIL